jgi:hypothetical protein
MCIARYIVITILHHFMYLYRTMLHIYILFLYILIFQKNILNSYLSTLAFINCYLPVTLLSLWIKFYENDVSMFKSVTNKSVFYGTADWQPIVINVKIHKNERKRLYTSNKENYLVETKGSRQISKFVLTKLQVKIKSQI